MFTLIDFDGFKEILFYHKEAMDLKQLLDLN